MSKKASLAKKIAHTLMAMSIVYSSGINIVINEAYAAERTENITSGGTKEFEEKTVNGGDYSSAQVTSSADAILTGKITEADVSSGEIKLEVQSGDGGDDNGDAPTTMQGSSSGTAVAKITVDESLSSITTGNITVSAYSGGHGSAYQGVSGVHGAAAAYGLEVKHDLTITAADIFVAAKAGQSNRYSSESRVDTDAAKGNDVVAVGLQADNSNVSFTGASLKVEAINKGIKTKNVDTTGKEKLSAGGDAEVYGIRVNGGEVTATLTGELLMDNAWAANGAGSTYTFAGGTGGKGHYLDVIARGSKLTNDFKLVDLSGNAAKADYDTWAYGISAEYGYRQNLNAGWFVEPQAELSLGHLGSADYTTSNGVSVKQDSVNSAVVRLGFLGGKEFTIGGHPSNAYVKASALHDFGGNGGATGYYENSSLALKTGDLTGTWYEIGLGANLGIAKNSNLYFDALKTFGGDLRTDWQFNAGLRFTF